MIQRSFATLSQFQDTVMACQVFDQAGASLSLAEGMQRSVQKILDIDRKRLTVLLVGNGGSSAIASHQAVDLWKNGGIRALAFNDAALLTCIGNDYGYPHVFAKPVEMFAKPGDLLIAVSSSGKSENIHKAVEAGKAAGCSVITFSGFAPGNPLMKMGDLNFYLPSDSYGVVEVGHLLLIHAIVDQTIHQKKEIEEREAKPTSAKRITDDLHH